MKSTTTVTTSSYYGNTSLKNNQQSRVNVLIPPQQMLKRLIPYANVQKQKENLKMIRQQASVQLVNKTVVIGDIQKLQSQLNNIHAEIIESQNFLNVRDSLYGQLDLLKDERQQIESDVRYLQTQFSSGKQVKISVRPNQGYRQMNERLRRRMHEIREYINKMDLQNRKIEKNINYSNNLNIQKNYRTQMNSNTWIDNASFNQGQRGIGKGKVDELITRLHMKQQEAMENVRRQEDDINKRNQFNRASFSTQPIVNNQFASRSYYPPSPSEAIGRRRFYSPEYRY